MAEYSGEDADIAHLAILDLAELQGSGLRTRDSADRGAALEWRHPSFGALKSGPEMALRTRGGKDIHHGRHLTSPPASSARYCSMKKLPRIGPASPARGCCKKRWKAPRSRAVPQAIIGIARLQTQRNYVGTFPDLVNKSTGRIHAVQPNGSGTALSSAIPISEFPCGEAEPAKSARLSCGRGWCC